MAGMMRSCRSLILAGMGIAAAVAAAGEPITMRSLLDEMVDLPRLSRMPDPPYTTRQASSYDRASTGPAELTDANWFANNDQGHFERIDRFEDETIEYVLMAEDGPGAIVRIWSANPEGAGTIRVYLDHADTPVIEMPFSDLLGGRQAPFIEPLGGERAMGWNLYLPIPYAAHCKVVATEPSFYYHINYRTYPEDTAVESFSLAQAEALAGDIGRVAQALANPVDAPPHLPAEPLLDHPIDMSLPGWSQGEVGIDLAGAVHRLEMRVEAEDMAAALRAAVLEIRFDGEAEPFVRAPLGDFFATAPGLNPYQSLPMGVREDGLMYSNWFMPFQRRIEVKVVNRGDDPLAVTGRLLIDPHEWTDGSLYFHAKWRHALDILTQPRQDFPFLAVEGAGRYVGNMLHVGNPVAAWWGEGDEKIFVDGEEFPGIFGTGTEDYYGYAWCDTALFTHAYHNQPRADGPHNYGNTLNSRFHVLDDIPFQQSIRFDMEIWHWADTTVNYAVTNYWYAAPDATDDTPPIDEALLVVPVIPPMPEPERVPGAIEGEDLEVLEATGGTVISQLSSQWGWSGDAQLWWIDAAPGDRLRVAFSVEEAGPYALHARFTGAPDYAIAQIRVNGQDAREPIDFYRPVVTALDEHALGVYDFEAGLHEVSIEIVGANPEAEPRRMVGLDYLRLAAPEPDPQPEPTPEPESGAKPTTEDPESDA